MSKIDKAYAENNDINSIDTSFLSLNEQIEHMNNIINSVTSLSNNNVLKDDMIAITTDIHGDFFSLLASLVESGIVNVKANDYKYYDLINEKFLTDSELKNIEYDERNSGTICAFPTPYINEKFNANIYILGDIGDRGPESVACFAFLYYILRKYEKINKCPIHIAYGNHESSKCATDSNIYYRYYAILKRMVKHNYIQTGYILGSGDKATALWHARFLDSDFENIFSIFIYLHNSKILYNFVENEFNRNNDYGLFKKIYSFIAKGNFETESIFQNFTKEELAKIKIFLGNGIIKHNIYLYKEGPVNDQISINIRGRNINFMWRELNFRGICNPLFWNDETADGESVLNQAVGHDIHINEIKAYGFRENAIVDFDIARSCGVCNNCKSVAMTTYYKKDNEGGIDLLNITNQTAYAIDREIQVKSRLFDTYEKKIYGTKTDAKLEEVAIKLPDCITNKNEIIFNEDSNFNNQEYESLNKSYPLSESVTSLNSLDLTLYNTPSTSSIDENSEKTILEKIVDLLKQEDQVLTKYIDAQGYGICIRFDDIEKKLSNILKFCKENENMEVLETIFDKCNYLFNNNNRRLDVKNDYILTELYINNKKISEYIDTVNTIISESDTDAQSKINYIKNNGFNITANIKDNDDIIDYEFWGNAIYM